MRYFNYALGRASLGVMAINGYIYVFVATNAAHEKEGVWRAVCIVAVSTYLTNGRRVTTGHMGRRCTRTAIKGYVREGQIDSICEEFYF